MLFISCYPEYRIDLDSEDSRLTWKETKREPAQRVVAQFIRGGLTDHARAEATKLPHFYRGVSRDEDPYSRLSFYDTVMEQDAHGWTDEYRRWVEGRLLELGSGDYMLVEEVKVPAPYANYAKHRVVKGRRTLENVFADIQQAYDLVGFDPGDAVAYERQNLNDPKVVAFLEGLAAEDGVGETEEVVAA